MANPGPGDDDWLEFLKRQRLLDDYRNGNLVPSPSVPIPFGPLDLQGAPPGYRLNEGPGGLAHPLARFAQMGPGLMPQENDANAHAWNYPAEHWRDYMEYPRADRGDPARIERGGDNTTVDPEKFRNDHRPKRPHDLPDGPSRGRPDYNPNAVQWTMKAQKVADHPMTGRPMLPVPGGVATEESITVTNPNLNGGQPTNIPSIWGGERPPFEPGTPEFEDWAVKQAIGSGQQFRPYGSIDEAVKAAKERSEMLGRALRR